MASSCGIYNGFTACSLYFPTIHTCGHVGILFYAISVPTFKIYLNPLFSFTQEACQCRIRQISVVADGALFLFD